MVEAGTDGTDWKHWTPSGRSTVTRRYVRRSSRTEHSYDILVSAEIAKNKNVITRATALAGVVRIGCLLRGSGRQADDLDPVFRVVELGGQRMDGGCGDLLECLDGAL